MKQMPITILKPAELANSIWMKIDDEKVIVDKELLEKEFALT